MKISKSKQELARIISENGGWRDWAKSAAQCKSDNAVSFYRDIPDRDGDCWWGEYLDGCDIVQDRLIANWHQSCLSRAEYLHLYPAPDSDGWIEWGGGKCPVDKDARIDIRMTGGKTYYDTDTHWGWNANLFKITHYRLHEKEKYKHQFCESVMPSIPEPGINSKNINITQVDDINVVESKPTIEQLAADYRNAKDYADRKQQGADDAKDGADAALSQLEDAIAAIGFVITPLAATEKEPEMVAAVKVGDQVECVESNIKRDKYNGMVGRLHFIDESDTSTPYLVDFGGEAKIWCHEVKFISRP